MSQEPILRVAVDAPLSRSFDYLPPAGCETLPRPGSRLLVPFGRRRQAGMLLETAAGSALPPDRLRRALAVLDPEPILGEADLSLLRFTAGYYHHPIGEVVACALPALLRQGKPLHARASRLRLTPEGARTDPEALRGRAPKQAALLALLRTAGALDEEALAAGVEGWRRPARALVDKGLAVLEEVEARPEPLRAAAGPADGPPLNAHQKEALAALARGAGFRVGLLDGVTGSGKTEVYLRLIREALERSRQVLVLVPEIGLTPQFVSRLEERLGVDAALLHSGLTDAERLAAWRAAQCGGAPLVLGTRSAVFTPLERPGLIVVDEEHDSSYKQQEGLRYSARDLAIARAKLADIPVVLGSATPSLETLKRCRDGAYLRLELPARAGGAAPPALRLVDLARHPTSEGLAQPSVDAIDRHLAAGGQVLVFLNRRGYAPTLICRGCGAVAECNRCDARMTVHARSATLNCHHCGASRRLDAACRECDGPMSALGQGTERLEDALLARFPGWRIERIDSDSTRARGAMDRALAGAASGETRIMVGTQILSKGHHFPALTLVVVVNADQGLFSTDFRGTERLAQSLVQVAGRAGREGRPGEVLIQTAFAAHPFWSALFAGGYPKVAAAELEERETTGWPPCSRLALLRASATRRADAHAFLGIAKRLAGDGRQDGLRVLGPVAAPMERKAGRYRAQLLLQGVNRQTLHEALAHLRPALEEERQARRVRWSLDVDPIELF